MRARTPHTWELCGVRQIVALKKIRIPNVEHGVPISLIREIKALQQVSGARTLSVSR